MQKENAKKWLKVAFMAGLITDALALLPMLSNWSARIFWGFSDFPGMYVFAMRLAAVFMLAWTLLLYCAWKKPLERLFVAPLTVFIIVGFFVLEVWAVTSGVMTFGKALPSMIMQIVLTSIFSIAYVKGIRATAGDTANDKVDQ